MEEEKKFKHCSVCKKKIGFFRRVKTKRQDASGKFPITQRQFCSPKCAIIGYNIILEMRDVKRRERKRVTNILDGALNMIAKRRSDTLRKYGSIDRVPEHELPLLYSGAYRLLEIIKHKVENANEKKESQFRDTQGHQ